MRFWRDLDDGRPVHAPTPVSLVILLVAALITGAGIGAYRYQGVWTPLQRQYLYAYVRSAVAWSPGGRYEMWKLIDRSGRRLAVDDEMVTVTSVTGERSFELSDTAVKAGATGLVWQPESYPHAALHAFLRRWIYHDQTLIDLVQPAFWGAFALFLGGLLGTRIQYAVDAPAWRPRYSARDAGYAKPPTIIDYEPGSTRSPASSQGLPGPRSQSALMPFPGRSTASTPRAVAADPRTRPRGLPQAPPSAWPGPFFK